jgi:protein ImuA
VDDNLLSARGATFAALKSQLRVTEHCRADIPDGGTIPVAPAIDPHLPAGGLALGAVHEVLAGEAGAASGFVALLAGRASSAQDAAGASILWIAPEPEVWAPGVARLGVRPELLVVVRARGKDALWAAEESLRCPAVAATIVEVPDLDLTTSRRLQLAAEAGRGIGLVLRSEQASISPTASLTRWRVSALPGTGRRAGELGEPAWRVELLKAKGGAAPLSWDLALHEDGLRPLIGESTIPSTTASLARSA